MNILEILLIFLSTLIFISPVLFFSQMNKEIIKKKNMIGIIPQAGSSSNETTEEKVLLVQSYEYLGLKEENSQKDFNQKIIEKTTEKFETIDAEVRGAQEQASEAKSVADNCQTDIDNLQKSVNGFDSKLDEKVEKEFGKGLSTNDYNNEDKSRVEALNSLFNEKKELILNEEKIQLSQPYVDLELTAEHTQKHFNEKVVEKIKKLTPKEQAQPKRVTEIKDNTFDYKELSKYDNRVLIRSNERDEYMDLDSFGSSKNFITTLVKGSGKGKIHITLDRKTHTIEATKGNYAVIIVNNNDKIVRLFNKYYPYTIVRSSKYVNFIESAKTTANVFEILNIGQKKGVSVSQSDDVVVLCYKETKPDYTKNIIKLNIDKNNFSQRINNINKFKYDIRGVVLTTDDVYNPESKHNVYISNSEEYTTEEFPKEIVIDVAGKQNYNIFYLVNVELTVNPESVVGLGDFELTLNKGFLSY